MSESQQLFTAAQEHIPGGVNSPVRAFNGVGGDPIFIKKAKGPNLYDVDDKIYTDYIGSWGPMILGHAHPDIIKAVKEAADNGLSYGAPTAIETQMADKVCELVPSIEMVRMVSSGTEATMSAIRLARGHTQRNVIVKFEGCYHGHVDSLLVKAGSGALTLGVPNSPGIPEDLAKYTLTLPFNDLAQVQETFAKVGSKIACIIVEPVAGNMNCIAPVEGFLEGLRNVCDEYGSLLIFDEVMTGFRVALGGAQEYYNIKPDLTCLGKIIGGGMPVGAFGGKKEIMHSIAPLGPVYQAGTLSGNPIAMAAGLKTLELISVDDFYESLTIKAKWLTQGMQQSADAIGIPFTTEQVGGMFGLFFSLEESVNSFKKTTECRMDLFKAFFHSMLEQGVYLAPSAYEAGFISNAHTTEDIEKTLVAAENSFIKIQEMV